MFRHLTNPQLPKTMVLIVIFCVLWLIWAIGLFAPPGPGIYLRAHGLIPLILIAILGYWAKGNMLTK